MVAINKTKNGVSIKDLFSIHLPSFDSFDSGSNFIEIVVSHVVVHLLVVPENGRLRVSVGHGAKAERRLVTLGAHQLSARTHTHNRGADAEKNLSLKFPFINSKILIPAGLRRHSGRRTLRE